MRVNVNKLAKGMRGEECRSCGEQWVAFGPDGRNHPEWRGCPYCMSKDVVILRGAAKHSRPG